jgi:cell wall-associated NlpC family hydrolase
MMALSPFSSGSDTLRRAALGAALVLLAGCSQTPSRPVASTHTAPPRPAQGGLGYDWDGSIPGQNQGNWFALPQREHAQEIVLYAMGLLDTGYRFGGSNPSAGLDCSGMVSYVVEQVSGKKLPHNAAQIADRTRPIPRYDMQPGDLVFFNTMGRPYSHMGIYLGEGKFIHAPNSKGRVRVERLDNTYFTSRFDGARSLLPSS